MFTMPFSFSSPVDPSASDPFWGSVVLLAKYDTDFSDVKGNAVTTSTTTNTPTIATGGKFGNGARMTTTSSFVRYAPTTNFLFGSGVNFTVDFWFTPLTSTPTGYMYDMNGSNTFGMQWLSGWRVLVGGLYFNPGNVYPPVAGVPMHMVFMRQGTTTGLLINGFLVSNNASAGTTSFGSSSLPMLIGATPNTTAVGNIYDDFRITRAARWTITGVANGTQVFTPPQYSAPTA